MPTGIDWVVIGEGVKNKPQGKVYTDIEDQLREAYGDIVLETARDDVRVPEACTAVQPVTPCSSKTQAAVAYAKIGRQTKLYR